MSAHTTFKVGDVVTFKALFLRSVGWYTDVPKNGCVIEVVDAGKPHEWCRVEWDGAYGITSVLSRNLILKRESA